MKKKTPWWAKRRFSCPDCGYIVSDDEIVSMKQIFTCARCKIVYDMEEFDELNYDKWSKEIKYE